MKLSKLFRLLFVFAMLVVLLLPASSVSAHTSFPTGPYIVEIGWLNEPPVAGQPNAIVVNLSAANQSCVLRASQAGLFRADPAGRLWRSNQAAYPPAAERGHSL